MKCDYCGSPDVAGTMVRERMQVHLGRWTLTLTYDVRRVCMAHLREARAPFTPEQLVKLAETLDTTQEEDA